MNHETLKLETCTKAQPITVKPKLSLDQYKEIVYLTKEYYRAFLLQKPLPKQALPSLETMLEASTVVNAYLKHSNLGLKFKLYNATLEAKQIVAVWCFANHSSLNIQLGNYALFAVQTQ